MSLFWTREDLKIFYKAVMLAQFEVKNSSKFRGSHNEFDLSYENCILIFNLAKEAVSNRGCNDLSLDIIKSLIKEEWIKLNVEFEHFNHSLEDISSQRESPLQDWQLFSYFAYKLLNIKKLP